MVLRQSFNYFPVGNGPFPSELRSPRVYFLDVRSVRLVVNPCAASLTEKTTHFQIVNLFVPIFGWTRIISAIKNYAYSINGTSSSATTLRILIIGLIAGPAVSL